jgi:nitrite reductase (NADH) small subunit
MTLATETATIARTWYNVCALEDIVPNTGVAALVGKKQIAVVRVHARDGEESLYALSNFDPFSKAMVLSRGIVGSKGPVAKITSPLYKQGFDLKTGVCLEDASVSIPTYPVRVVDGTVQIAV